MQKLTMSMCASRDYLQGYNKAVDDASKEMDALRARVAELEAAIEDTHSALGGIIEHEGIRLHAIRTKALLVDAEFHWSHYKDRVAELEKQNIALRGIIANLQGEKP